MSHRPAASCDKPRVDRAARYSAGVKMPSPDAICDRQAKRTLQTAPLFREWPDRAAIRASTDAQQLEQAGLALDDIQRGSSSVPIAVNAPVSVTELGNIPPINSLYDVGRTGNFAHLAGNPPCRAKVCAMMRNINPVLVRVGRVHPVGAIGGGHLSASVRLVLDCPAPMTGSPT